MHRFCTGVWTNFEPMEHNLLSLSTLDPISPTHSGMVEMGSNVLKAKILHSISPKLVQTPVCNMECAISIFLTFHHGGMVKIRSIW